MTKFYIEAVGDDGKMTRLFLDSRTDVPTGG